MIRASTGEFKLDKYDLIIHPELTFSQFQAANIPLAELYKSEKGGWRTGRFTTPIDGMNADFIICFKLEKLHKLIWRPSEAKEESTNNKQSLWTKAAERLKNAVGDKDYLLEKQMDIWLEMVIGSLPPYGYEWGNIVSDTDIHSAEPIIMVVFKHWLWEQGIVDFKKSFEEQKNI